LPFGTIELESAEASEEYETSLAMTQKAVAELEEAVRWERGHARAHLRLAEAYVRLFHLKQQASANVMSVNQIRDAVIDSRAESVPPDRRLNSRDKLERWLATAIGDHYEHLDRALVHCRLALSFCPLLGEGYLFLGELCFLEGGRSRDKAAYVAQALKVRPFDGTVLLHAGNEAILAGNLDQGLTYWQDSFCRGPVCQQQIVEWLAGRVNPTNPEEEIRFFLETFRPGLEALRLIESRYRKIARPDQMALLYLMRAQAAEEAAEEAADDSDLQGAAELWLDAMRQHCELGDAEQRLRCGRNAFRSDPNSCLVRERLAQCLADLGWFAEAREHLDWCIKRRPDADSLRERLEKITRQEIAARQGVVGSPRNAAGRSEDGQHRAEVIGPGRQDDLRQAGRPQFAPAAPGDRQTPFHLKR
jgi:tetratricopeptide (TPR) repeat protein